MSFSDLLICASLEPNAHDYQEIHGLGQHDLKICTVGFVCVCISKHFLLYILTVCWLFYVNLTQNRVIGEREP